MEKAWKGITQESVTVSTSSNSGLCGYNFKMGESYLVYTYGEYSTSICSRTRQASGADEDLLALGEPSFTTVTGTIGLAPKFLVLGGTVSDLAIQQVVVDGVALPVVDGKFLATVAVAGGKQSILIVAGDAPAIRTRMIAVEVQ